MATMSITERAQPLPCTHKRNMNAMWPPNDVNRPVFYLYDMMLANDNTPRHAARSTHVILVTNKRRTLQWPAQSMDLNPSMKHVWNIFKRNVRAQPLLPNLRERMSVTHQMCHSTTIPNRYILSWGTMYVVVIATAGGHTKYWNEIK